MEKFGDKPNLIAITKQRDLHNNKSKTSFMFEKPELLTEATTFAFILHYSLSFVPIQDETETRRLIKEAQEGNIESLNYLWERNMRAVLHICHKYFTPNDDLEDIIQEGNLAIRKAILKFDLKRNVSFSTFMYRVIIGDIHNYLHEMYPYLPTSSDMDEKLRDYVSYTELRNLLTNFTTFKDLYRMLPSMPPRTKGLLKRFVSKFYVKHYSFDECMDQILDEINLDTRKEYVGSHNETYVSLLEEFVNTLFKVGMMYTSKRNIYIYCRVKGLLEFDPTKSKQDLLDEFKMSYSNFTALENTINTRVYEGEFSDKFRKIVNEMIIERRNYYEGI